MDIKEAVQNAITFARESLGPDRTEDIRLEEIESSTVDGRPVWLITLSSAKVPRTGYGSALREIRAAVGAETEREYKTFTVTKDTGETVSMKIRLLAVPIG